MRRREEIEKEMRKASAELATIVYYVNGSISERPRKYTKKDGSESEQKALPTLQYYAGGRQGGKRVPRKLLPAMRQRVANGRRRKELLRRLDELAAELTLVEIEEGVQKKLRAVQSGGADAPLGAARRRACRAEPRRGPHAAPTSRDGASSPGCTGACSTHQPCARSWRESVPSGRRRDATTCD